MIISNSQDSFLDIISPTITPPRGIPNTIMLLSSFLFCCSFFTMTSFNASPKIFAAFALSFILIWNLLLILSNIIYTSPQRVAAVNIYTLLLDINISKANAQFQRTRKRISRRRRYYIFDDISSYLYNMIQQIHFT